MSTKKTKDPFWTSYSDLMTSLFFVMLVLFIISLIRVGREMRVTQDEKAKVDSLLAEAKVTIEQQRQVLQLEKQFEILGQSTCLGYDPDKKMFYAKDFVGIEIFLPNKDEIKNEYLNTVDKVGDDLINILKSLQVNNFHYQLVIEGTAAIKWDKLKNKTYDPDNVEMYMLSYRRALALYNRWRKVGKHDFRKYNTEIIISGSGFNGINRDQKVEENNKRFVIQIIPKIGKPNTNNMKHE